MKPYKSILLILFQLLAFCPLGNAFTVPDFINQVPKEHFAGISVPCSNGLREARNSAIADVVKQVLGAINTEYKHSYENQVSGDPKNPNIFIKDTYTRFSSSDIVDCHDIFPKQSEVNLPAANKCSPI